MKKSFIKMKFSIIKMDHCNFTTFGRLHFEDDEYFIAVKLAITNATNNDVSQ